MALFLSATLSLTIPWKWTAPSCPYVLMSIPCVIIHHTLHCAWSLSRGWLFATPQTVALQTLQSVGCSSQEDWSGSSCPPPGDLPYPGIEPVSLASPALAGVFFTTGATWEVLFFVVESLTHVWFLWTQELYRQLGSSICGFPGQEYQSGLPFPSPVVVILFLINVFVVFTLIIINSLPEMS